MDNLRAFQGDILNYVSKLGNTNDLKNEISKIYLMETLAPISVPLSNLSV